MQQCKFNLDVVMQKRVIDNRWQTELWEPLLVLLQMAETPIITGAERVGSEANSEQWLFRGFQFALRTEDAEGYYLNISTQQPRVFVRWELEKELGVPRRVTANYNEACTWMDAGEQVGACFMPPEMYDAVSAFTREHYRPQPKKRIRPRSFQSMNEPPRSRRG